MWMWSEVLAPVPPSPALLRDAKADSLPSEPGHLLQSSAGNCIYQHVPQTWVGKFPSVLMSQAVSRLTSQSFLPSQMLQTFCCCRLLQAAAAEPWASVIPPLELCVTREPSSRMPSIKVIQALLLTLADRQAPVREAGWWQPQGIPEEIWKWGHTQGTCT